MKANGLLRHAVAALLVFSLTVQSVVAGGAVLVINQDGSYQVMVDGPGGKSVLVDVGQVVDKRGSTPPGGGGGTPPGTTDPIADQIKAWSVAVGDPTSAQALAIVYRKVGEQAQGKSRAQIQGALKAASDEVLAVTKGTEKWKGWRQNVSGLIDAEEAKGAIDWSKFCSSVAIGLEKSAGNTALDPILIETIIRLVLQIIQLFLNGGLGGGGGGGV